MIPESRIRDNAGTNNPTDDSNEKIEAPNKDEIVEVSDAQGDVNIAAKLPLRGVYTIKWEAKKENGVYSSKTKKEPHRSYVAASLVGAIQDDEFEGTFIYVQHINSLQQRGKQTSDLHHFLYIVGAPAKNKSTIGELESHTERVLEDSPLGMAELDWKASYKNSEGEYIDLIKTMSKFPKHYIGDDGKPLSKELGGKWDGTYEQSVPNPEDDEPINAQLYVRQHLTQSEANNVKKKLGQN